MDAAWQFAASHRGRQAAPDAATVWPVRALFAIFALLVACDEPDAPPAREPSRELVAPEALLPLSIGDRWRERIDGRERTRGVTAHTLEGLAVVFGQGDVRPSFYRADASEAGLVDPEGRMIEPLLRAPLEVGARFDYTLGDGPTAARCEADVVALDARARVGGAALEGCVRIVRRCVHPAGVVFEVETTRRTEETYCPRVGRVRVQQTIDPPLAGAEGTSVVELVSFRVAGAPVTAPPARFGCDAVLLLPSDVAAACGPEWRFAGEEESDGACVHRFSAGEGTLEVRVSRGPDESGSAAALDAWLAERGPELTRIGETHHASRDGVHRLAGTEGRHLVALETRGCEPERAARLVPFLRSLL